MCKGLLLLVVVLLVVVIVEGGGQECKGRNPFIPAPFLLFAHKSQSTTTQAVNSLCLNCMTFFLLFVVSIHTGTEQEKTGICLFSADSLALQSSHVAHPPTFTFEPINKQCSFLTAVCRTPIGL